MTTTTTTTGGMKEQSVITEVLGYSPRIKILDYLLDFPTNDFTKKEIIEALGMSKQTFYKYFDSLEKYGMVEVSRTIGKAKLYKINSGSDLVKSIRDLEKKMSLQIAEKEEADFPKISVPEPKISKQNRVSVHEVKQSRNSSIARRAARLQTHGWKVRADITGFKRPTYLRIGETKMRPDIVARKGKVVRIVEFKSSDKSQNASLLRKYAKENKNVELSVEPKNN